MDEKFIIKLSQAENDVGEGEIINLYPPKESAYLQSHKGLTATQLKLDNTASPIPSHYVNFYIKITSGPFTNQVRRIATYNGGFSKIATISTPWTPIELCEVSITKGSNKLLMGRINMLDEGDLIVVNSRVYTVFSIDSKELILATNALETYCGTAYLTHPRTNESYIVNNECFTGLIYDRETCAWKLCYKDDVSEFIGRLSSLQVSNIDTRTINGNVVSMAINLIEYIRLPDNNNSAIVIENTDLRGAYQIIVQSDSNNGACAIFNVVKSSMSGVPNIVKQSSKGATNEELDILYNVGEKIKLYHSVLKSNGNGSALLYKVKVIVC